MALESVVLLKNEGNLLPLNKKAIKSIAVIGPLADSVHWDWYGGTPPYAITPLQGIKEVAGSGITVNYAENELGAAALAAARKSDVAIVSRRKRPNVRSGYGPRVDQCRGHVAVHVAQRRPGRP